MDSPSPQALRHKHEYSAALHEQVGANGHSEAGLGAADCAGMPREIQSALGQSSQRLHGAIDAGYVGQEGWRTQDG